MEEKNMNINESWKETVDQQKTNSPKQDQPKDKNIDESWKDSAEKQKENVKNDEKKEPAIPEATFSFFVTTLGFQIAIALGEIENPMTNKIDENLNQAKFLIDTLDMLKEKTKNNLSKEEESLLEHVLYDFHTKFVAKKENINL